MNLAQTSHYFISWDFTLDVLQILPIVQCGLRLFRAEVEGVEEALALDCDSVPLLQDQASLPTELEQKL